MNISKSQIDDLNAIISIELKPEDYQGRVNTVLRNYVKTAKVPGFRPGHVPIGMVKKMYGKAVLVEELNRMLSEELGKYIYSNKIEVLGSPLPKRASSAVSYTHLQVLGYKVQPRFLTEGSGFVYMSDPENGILVFDLFGTYYKLLPFKGLKSFQVIDQNILFVKENKLFRYDSKTAAEQEVLLPVHDSILNARIEGQQLYLLTSDSLSFYSF